MHAADHHQMGGAAASEEVPVARLERRGITNGEREKSANTRVACGMGHKLVAQTLAPGIEACRTHASTPGAMSLPHIAGGINTIGEQPGLMIRR